MYWLIEAFARAESLEDRLKISTNLGLNIAHLAKLVRIQELIKADRPPENGGLLDTALTQVLRELGRI